MLSYHADSRLNRAFSRRVTYMDVPPRAETPRLYSCRCPMQRRRSVTSSSTWLQTALPSVNASQASLEPPPAAQNSAVRPRLSVSRESHLATRRGNRSLDYSLLKTTLHPRGCPKCPTKAPRASQPPTYFSWMLGSSALALFGVTGTHVIPI